MEHSYIIKQLSQNQNTFKDLLSGISREEYMWKLQPEKWCLLEIICHLYDEEQYDFKARVKSVLENPDLQPPQIDPAGWVKSRKYIEQNYEDMLKKFLDERKKSIVWLYSLENPKWKNEYIHPSFGAMSAEFFLVNWVAHDYLHFRQIITQKFNYLKEDTGINPIYAGEW